MSVYEIEQTMLRLGDALRKHATGAMNFTGNITAADLEKQIGIWEKVLKNYRATTTSTSAQSVAAQLDDVLQTVSAHFGTFWEDLKDDTSSELATFVADGLTALTANQFKRPPAGSAPGYDGNDGGANEQANELSREGYNFHATDFESDAKGVGASVTYATANDCDAVAGVLDGKATSNLCNVYHDIGKNAKLIDTLMNICSFKDLTNIPSVQTFCKSGEVPSVAASSPKKPTPMSAFDFLTDTTKFLTFSGTSGTDISWNVAEARGTGHTVTTDGSMTTGWNYDGNLGFSVGRRLNDESRSSGPASLAGYAYPASGPVHAVSKKLLEVTPEMLGERRRKLTEERTAVEAPSVEKRRLAAGFSEAIDKAVTFLGEKAQANKGQRNDGIGSGCRRRRLQIGIQGCVSWGTGGSSDFSVSMSQTANNASDLYHTVAVSLRDPNQEDLFVLSMSQDPVYGTVWKSTDIATPFRAVSRIDGVEVDAANTNASYGTPIFTTFGGRSSCVGETGTTKRDSRVTIKEIQPMCGEKCSSHLKCKCENLPLGQDAVFSVVLQNLSPWESSSLYNLRISDGASTNWFAGKYNKKNIHCDPGDSGSLTVLAVGASFFDLRNGEGISIYPLPYGQTEVLISVSRPESPAQQCYSYKDIELTLVSACEQPDFDTNEGVYQYDTSSIDPKTGDFKVIHPKYDNTTYSFKKGTAALGAASSTATFDVSWSSAKPEPESCTPGTCFEMLVSKPGCTYPEASNYDPTAKFDDGSCTFTTEAGKCPDVTFGVSDPRDCPDDTEPIPPCTHGGLRPGDLCLEDGTCSDGRGSVCRVSSGRRHLRRLLEGDKIVMIVGPISRSLATQPLSSAPTSTPTGSPAPSVSAVPTTLPTEEPTLAPTSTFAPTRSETYAPTRAMTNAPSYAPTTDTYAPTSTPSATAAPSSMPSATAAPTTTSA